MLGVDEDDPPEKKEAVSSFSSAPELEPERPTGTTETIELDVSGSRLHNLITVF